MAKAHKSKSTVTKKPAPTRHAESKATSESLPEIVESDLAARLEKAGIRFSKDDKCLQAMGQISRPSTASSVAAWIEKAGIRISNDGMSLQAKGHQLRKSTAFSEEQFAHFRWISDEMSDPQMETICRIKNLEWRGLSIGERLLLKAALIEDPIWLQMKRGIKPKAPVATQSSVKSLNVRADTQRFSEAAKNVKCPLTQELLFAQFHGLQNGQTISQVNVDFRRENNRKLGKTAAEREQKWSAISRRARDVMKPFK